MTSSEEEAVSRKQRGLPHREVTDGLILGGATQSISVLEQILGCYIRRFLLGRRNWRDCVGSSRSWVRWSPQVPCQMSSCSRDQRKACPPSSVSRRLLAVKGFSMESVCQSVQFIESFRSVQLIACLTTKGNSVN